ncbi:MerR family transcriptional regulator [Actinosynnema sp. ALI-1.44]|uniref:MerR family transcriptional regulator n=1 Tax=Actinosynnema sp. ALI-1.44 TaxID=1933779 RepID=UPI00097C80CB|nr:MerR family transcriptional regulator [Actinosynnema sp. ALI-1.44]ONI79871.1 MerR family transcriptional regulator [Actinosynnema sp. ALI-1.44]
MSETLSIGQVAERTGLSVHTLRFYEREELLTAPVTRDTGRRRVYTEDDVEWLTMCANFRATGMPLPVIRAYAALVRQGPGNEQDRLNLLREHERRIAERMSDLAACQELISYKVRVYESRVAHGTTGGL